MCGSMYLSTHTRAAGAEEGIVCLAMSLSALLP